MCTDLWKWVQLPRTERSPPLSAAVNTNSWQSQTLHSLSRHNLGGKRRGEDRQGHNKKENLITLIPVMYVVMSKIVSQGKSVFFLHFFLCPCPLFFSNISQPFPLIHTEKILRWVVSYRELWTSACLRTSLQRAPCCWEGWTPCTSAPRLPPNNLDGPRRRIVRVLYLVKEHGELHCPTFNATKRDPRPLTVCPINSPDLSSRIWSFWHSSMNPEMRLANSTTYWIAWVIWMAHCCHNTSRGWTQTPAD